jgi:hypothetical protein
LAIVVILFSSEALIKRDINFRNTIYKKLVFETIDISIKRNKAQCDTIDSWYFYYDDKKVKTDTRSFEHKSTAIDLCNTASKANIESNYNHCLTNQTIIDLENARKQREINDSGNKNSLDIIYELKSSSNYQNTIICLELFKKHHSEDVEGTEEFKERLFQQYNINDIINNTYIEDYVE